MSAEPAPSAITESCEFRPPCPTQTLIAPEDEKPDTDETAEKISLILEK